jgi:hypothetical protein
MFEDEENNSKKYTEDEIRQMVDVKGKIHL